MGEVIVPFGFNGLFERIEPGPSELAETFVFSLNIGKSLFVDDESALAPVREAEVERDPPPTEDGAGDTDPRPPVPVDALFE